jgi:glycosyltransferase involved in cell wall biosynthesis
MATFGSVVLAAYEPDPTLFARQLASIQHQTVSDFECLIAADGDAAHIRRLVAQTVGSDSRFRVIGFDDRVGFYRNFERGLRAIDGRSTWVALSDQDDYWYPEKLEVLLPMLTRYAMVSGQARLVAEPSGTVLAERTGRRNTTPCEIVIDNQYTGSFTVFRSEVLGTALPFPRVQSRAEVHDHWIAVCASATGGTFVSDEVLQDYAQHGRNVLGESRLHKNGLRPIRIVRSMIESCRHYEGSISLRSFVRFRYRQVLGWDQAMASTLFARLPGNDIAATIKEVFGPRRKVLASLRFLVRATMSRSIPLSTAAMFLQAWALEPFARTPSPEHESDDADRHARGTRETSASGDSEG